MPCDNCGRKQPRFDRNAASLNGSYPVAHGLADAEFSGPYFADEKQRLGRSRLDAVVRTLEPCTVAVIPPYERWETTLVVHT